MFWIHNLGNQFLRDILQNKLIKFAIIFFLFKHFKHSRIRKCCVHDEFSQIPVDILNFNCFLKNGWLTLLASCLVQFQSLRQLKISVSRVASDVTHQRTKLRFFWWNVKFNDRKDKCDKQNQAIGVALNLYILIDSHACRVIRTWILFEF